MAAQNYTLTFDGYWREPNIGGLPAGSGIYCVYACTHRVWDGTVSIRRLLYIGESGNVKARVAGHERWLDWKAKLMRGEELCFSAALISPELARQRAEAAMIFRHKPPCNAECVHEFPFSETTVWTSGASALLEALFTVQAPARVGAYGRW